MVLAFSWRSSLHPSHLSIALRHSPPGPPTKASRRCSCRPLTAQSSISPKPPKARPTAMRCKDCSRTMASSFPNYRRIGRAMCWARTVSTVTSSTCSCHRRSGAIQPPASPGQRISCCWPHAQRDGSGLRDTSRCRVGWCGPSSILIHRDATDRWRKALPNSRSAGGPILDAFEAAGARVGFELHPGEDLHDGVSFERFLGVLGEHTAAGILYDPSHLFLQHIDYGGFLDVYHERIVAFHVKDAEWNRSAKTGVYAGYIDWLERAGRFRSLGDGDIDFGLIFSKLTQYDYSGWASLEWECCLKHPEDGARDGARFIRDHIIPVQARAFDAGMTGTSNPSRNRKILGLATTQDSGG